MNKKAMTILMVLLLLPAFSLLPQAEASSDDTWAVYWYLCGSDLESEDGFATDDLLEMMEASLPENVVVVIQTGGAYEWQNDVVSPDYAQRFEYDGEELYEIEVLPKQNMGDAETLSSFLAFCTTNYPADRQAVIIWNHGGGSVAGVACDEQYDMDALTLADLYTAFDAVAGESSEPMFELIGFDACLMATIDTAWVLQGFANYMVASQEMEPAVGWDYEAILNALAEDPSMDGKSLGKVICDSYQQSCYEYELDDMITLSVVDLTALQPLLDAYDALGMEALLYASENPSFFAQYGRSANSAENYGGNTRDEGYANMVDLGDLVSNAENILPENAREVLKALDQCVVYSVNGPYRARSSGLSCYYPYNGDEDEVYAFADASASYAYYYFYEYETTGELSDEGIAYLSEMETIPGDETQPSTASPAQSFWTVPSVTTLDLEDYPVYVDEDGYAVLDLGSDISDCLSAVYFQLAIVDVEEDIILLLGRDNNLDADWENGIMRDNFTGMWGALDGCLVYMEIIYEGDDYNLYTIPILLNGEEYNLRISYDYNSGEYAIIGALKGLYDNGMSNRNLITPAPGDVITTLHYAMTVSGADEEPQLLPIDTITVSDATAFEDVDMGDGTFLMMFEMVDAGGNSMLSDAVWITVEDGEIEVNEA